MNERSITIKALFQSSLSPVVFIYTVVYLSLFAGLFHSSYSYMFDWWKSEDYNYCYVIPFIIIYFLWEKRKTLALMPSCPSWLGIIGLIVGLLLYWLGELGGEYYIQHISSWLVLVSLCLLHLGLKKIKVIRFAFILLLGVFPLPMFIYNNVSLKLQLVSSQVGVFLIRLCGISAVREGNVIDLGSTQLQVVEACNGLRYLFPLMLLGLNLAYFFRAPCWKKVVLFLSTIPLAIFVNSLRIAMMGVSANMYGPVLLEGFSHAFSGWAVFMVSLAFLVGVMWALGGISFGSLRDSPQSDAGQYIAVSQGVDEVREPSVSGSEFAEPSSDTVNPEGLRTAGAQRLGHSDVKGKRERQGLRKHGKFIVAFALLGVTFVLSLGFNFRDKIPIRKPLADFPMSVADWRGVPQAMDSASLALLRLSDHLMAEYSDSHHQAVSLYIAYYDSQRKGESVHTPATCLPGSGWVTEQAGILAFPIPNYEGGTITVSRALIQKLNERQLVYYWFPQRGRVLNNLYELKLYAFWDTLTRQRSDGALVRLITPVYDSETLEEADKRMQEFTRMVLPVLEQFIPGRDIS